MGDRLGVVRTRPLAAADRPLARQAEAHSRSFPPAPGGGAQRTEDIVAEFRDPALRAALLAEHGYDRRGRTLLAALHVAELIEETAQVAALARC